MMPPCGYQNWWQRLRGKGFCWNSAKHLIVIDMVQYTACNKRRHYAKYLTDVATAKEAQPL